MDSKYDDLTGLKTDTRGLELKQTLLDAKQSGQTVGMLYIDLDRLHPWNHEHGHSAGDTLLRHLAGIMQQVVGGQGETWRIGGEEFLITLPATSITAAQELAERLRVQAAQQTIDVEGLIVPSVTMTLGVAVYPEHGESEEALLRVLQNAVERGKVEGRNCVRVVGY